MRSAPTFIAVIVTLCVCALAFLTYLMWSTKHESVAAPATSTVVSQVTTTVTATATPTTVTVTASPSSSSEPDDATPALPPVENGACDPDQVNQRVNVNGRTLVCAYQGLSAPHMYMWEYSDGQ